MYIFMVRTYGKTIKKKNNTHSLINVMPKVELYDVCSDTLITTALPANNPEIT